MVFAEPQWVFKTARVAQEYAYVSSRVSICPERGKTRYVHLEIPAEFFILVPKLFSPAEVEAARQHGMHFFLDQMGDRWVLGVEIGGPAPAARDLWPYTKSILPPWFDVAFRPGR